MDVYVSLDVMQKALLAQRNKTDRNDARGIAHMMRMGRFRAVHVKSPESLQLRFLLSGRRLLKRKFLDVENELPGALKAFGLVIGAVSRGQLEARTRALVDGAPRVVVALVETLLGVRRTLLAEYGRLHREIVRVVCQDGVCRRFMTIPGVGPVTALAFKTAIDDPARCRGSHTVGAHFGLTPRRIQSGTVGYSGRISRTGDPEARCQLHSAANSLLTRCKK